MSNRVRWLLIAAASVLPLLGWWSYGLFDLDEGFYAAVVAEMNRRGEWVTPYYNGSTWFEKPILLYWLAKPAIALLGDALGPRLPSILCTLGLYALVAWFCRRRFDEETAQQAVLVLAGSLLLVAVGRMMMTDMPLLLALTAALLCFYESVEGDRRWRWVAGACVGLGVLAKGPVALLLFLAIAGWSLARYPSFRTARRGGWLGFAVLAALVIGSWYVPAYLASGQLFVREFLIEQNIGRFTGGDRAHTLGPEAILAYVPILLLGMLPWSLWIPAAFTRERSESDLTRFLGAWAFVVFLFFSLSGAKLPHYILPVLPPAAILVARRLRGGVWQAFGLAWCVVVALVAQFGFLWWYRASGQAEAHATIRELRGRAAADPIAFYQLGRVEADRGTGTLKLRETSLPSLIFYLDRTVLDTAELDDILDVRQPVWVFTREGRMGHETLDRIANAGRSLEPVPTRVQQKHFRLYRLR